MKIRNPGAAVAAVILTVACASVPETPFPADLDARLAAMSKEHVFADMHAHPSRFHRANVLSIAAAEIDIYRNNHFSLTVANISSDMAYTGRYTNRDGSEIKRGKYKPAPGESYALAADRMLRLHATFDQNLAVHADRPDTVLRAQAEGQLAVMPALEGADALEGDLENLQRLHAMGLGLLQLVHFRANELGHIQTHPYSPGGLTGFGREVVREANALGIIIDLAHANTQTIMDVLELSEHPIIFSHGGLKALIDQDRALTDDEVRAIAQHGGIVGIWPNGKSIPDVAQMVDHIEHVIEIAGVDHVGIGSDLRGVSRYSEGFEAATGFRVIAAELLRRGYRENEVGQIMGGNFFRLWQQVYGNRAMGAADVPFPE